MRPIEVMPLKVNVDERGSVSEIYRDDWVLDRALQAVISRSRAGVIRAWHRHRRGQRDYVFVLSGTIRIAVYDDRLPEKEVLEEIVSEEDPKLAMIDGRLWHGYRALTDCIIIYFVTRLYDHTNPDEERRDPNDREIGYDWLK